MSGSHTIGRAIKIGRAERGMTQQQLGDNVRCSRVTIVSIESGVSNPGFALAFRISRALGFGLDSVVPNETHAD